jgi:signal transduction histidine kinase
VVAQLLAALAVVLVVVGVLGSLAAGRLAEREAVNDAARTADVLAEAVVMPGLSDAVADGDAAAVAAFDTLVRQRVLTTGIVRVKLWSPEGQVVYADEPALIGRTFALGPDQRDALSQPRTQAEVSELTSSENQFESGGRLLEVYRPVWTPSGRELLFETYSAYDAVSERSSSLWRGFAGVTLSCLLLLVVLMTPVVGRLLRRLGDAQRHRERLLERTLEASDAERRRVAATLHDGPVQDLAASAFVAAGAAAKAEGVGQPRLAAELRGLAASGRANIRVLRSLLVDIYPPSLSDAGLASALADLAASVSPRGVQVQLELADVDGLGLSADEERLVYRVAQECLRNSAAHAAPCAATIRLGRIGSHVVLVVEDDGLGFEPASVERPAEGHFGLRVVADLAGDAGAMLEVASEPGRGTAWRLTLDAEGVGV